MYEKPILAIFDFCGTLINFQTADPFIKGLSKKHSSPQRRVMEAARKFLFKTGIINGKQNKQLLLQQAAGIHTDSARKHSRRYLYEKLLPNENSKIVERMKEHIKQKDCVVIASAGYETYIRLYANHYNIEKVAATNLEKKQDWLTGKILGKDCIGEEKTRRLAEIVDLSSFDLQNSYAYTDHMSDIPLLELVGNKVVVDYGQDTYWCKELGCEIVSV